jgi:PA14 domain
MSELELEICGCCEDGSQETLALYNPPGLAALFYRLGTHARFKSRMLAKIAPQELEGRDRPLAKLTTRNTYDPSIALIDAAATVLDVLCFYQERIANEGYLRTAAERTSVLALARSIGYELSPGVAASTYLAFDLETAPGSPDRIGLETGKIKVQSLPGPGEQAQIFETVEALEARPEWNALRPQQSELRYPRVGDVYIYLDGITTNLRPGDPLLIVGDELIDAPGSERWEFQRVLELETDAGKTYTRVRLTELGSRIPTVLPLEQGAKVYALRLRASVFGYNAPDWNAMPNTLKRLYANQAENNSTPNPAVPEWPHLSLLKISGNPLAPNQFNLHLDSVYSQITAGSWIITKTPNDTELYRVDKVSEDSRTDFTLSAKTTKLVVLGKDLHKHFDNKVRELSVFAQSEELKLAQTPLTVPYDVGAAHIPLEEPALTPLTGNEIVLDRLIEGLEKGKALILTGKTMRARLTKGPRKLVSLEDSAISKTLLPDSQDGSGLYADYFDDKELQEYKFSRTDARVDFDWGVGSPDPTIAADTFSIRWTGWVKAAVTGTYTFTTNSDDGVRLWVNGQLLVDKWILQGATKHHSVGIQLEADHKYALKLEYFENGGAAVIQLLWTPPSQVEGIIPTAHLYPRERHLGESLRVLGVPTPQGLKVRWLLEDAEGFVGEIDAAPNDFRLMAAAESDPEISELVFLAEALEPLNKTYTRLKLQKSLQNLFDRATVQIRANVLKATHGETKQEVLGSGQAGQAFQRFPLKQKPLTYSSAPTPSGRESSLELHINDILWDDVNSLYAQSPRAQVYATRIADDGVATVQFGDGVMGARLPSGQENVRANYRVGSGLAGMVKAKQLSLLLTRPLGVKSAINPLAPTGAADPETLAQARSNAPLTVLTLERIVSLRDYQDFARAFAGIGKAQAVELRQGERRLVHITVAAVNGGAVLSDEDPYKNLKAAIQTQSDAHQSFVLESYASRTFNLTAWLRIKPRYLTEKVLPAVQTALLEAFGFEARGFGQMVTGSELIATMQAVAGVVSVDLDFLYFKGNPPSLPSDLRLSAKLARWSGSNTLPAELLTLNKSGIELLEVKP